MDTLLSTLKRIKRRHESMTCVVCGEFPTRKMLQGLLTGHGLPPCSTVENGAAALGLLGKNSKTIYFFYDMAISDVNGLQFLTTLAKSTARNRVHVILLTPPIVEESRLKILKMGAVGLLSKPITQESVHSLLLSLGLT